MISLALTDLGHPGHPRVAVVAWAAHASLVEKGTR
jgi:hypothetical protein